MIYRCNKTCQNAAMCNEPYMCGIKLWRIIPAAYLLNTHDHISRLMSVMSLDTSGAVWVAIIIVTIAVSTATSLEPLQRAFADAPVGTISLTVASNITGNYELFPASGGVGDVTTFELAGNVYAAVASDREVQILNLTDPYNIVLAGEIGNLASRYVQGGGLTIVTFESYGRIYAVVGSGEGVQILNLTDPHNIVLADSIAHDFGAGIIEKPTMTIFESDDRIYALVSTFMGDGYCLKDPFNDHPCRDYNDTTILQVVDVTDPHVIFDTFRMVFDGLHPYHSSHMATFESADRVYVIVNPSGRVQVLDVTDPTRIMPADRMTDDNNLFLKFFTDLFILDLDDDRMTDDDSLFGDSVKLVNTFESADHIYAVVYSYRSVQVLNLTNPYSIVSAGPINYSDTFHLSGATNMDTFESAGRVYAVASTHVDMRVLNLTDPQSIYVAGSIAYDDPPWPGGPKNVATFESNGHIYAVVGLDTDVRVVQLTANTD